jgi:hypothetical protein
MDDTQRLNLKQMVKEYKTEETTEKIRKLHHSKLLRNDVKTLTELHNKYNRLYKSNYNQFQSLAESRCEFLYKNYTNIFNKLLKKHLDVKILNKFINMLEKIENNQIDQHEASFKIGSLLKEMYVDSALKENNKKQNIAKKEQTHKKITWAQYKKNYKD